jgi:zinc/manganese transport system substrate-binding protein
MGATHVHNETDLMYARSGGRKPPRKEFVMNANRSLAAALAVVLASLAGLNPAGAAPVRAVTTTEDAAVILEEVGGDHVEVESLTRGYQDPHFVDARPSYLVKLNKADLFVQIGLDIEAGWVPALLTSARNPDIIPGSPGFVDLGLGIDPLEVPRQVDRSQGDVHPLGNPHYWLGPSRGIEMSRTLRDALIRLRPAEADDFRQRQADFEARLTQSIERWKAHAERIGLPGMQVVTYHRSWSYFAEEFGLLVIDFVEPRPGVPPSPAHVHDLVERMKAHQVPLLLVEPYFDPKLPERVAHDTGTRLVILPSSVGAQPEIKSYFDLFDSQLAQIEEALAGS